MRLLLLILGIGVGVVGIENRAEAQNYPWCAPPKGTSDIQALAGVGQGEFLSISAELAALATQGSTGSGPS